MENVRHEGTGYQSVTSPSGEALGINVHVRRSKRIIKYPQRYNPGVGDDREWKNDNVASIVYMIKYGGLNRNIDTNDILSLLDEWYTEYFMNMTSTFHMREYFVIKSQRNNHINLMYLKALSNETQKNNSR